MRRDVQGRKPRHGEGVVRVTVHGTMIRLTTDDGKRRDISAEVVIGGLAIHCAIDGDGEGWTITHTPSGRAIARNGQTLEETSLLLNALLECGVDWKTSFEKITIAFLDTMLLDRIKGMIITYGMKPAGP